MNLPHSLRYGRQEDPFHMEYDRREGHFTMGRFHIHRCYEIFYLMSGERGYFINDRTYLIRAGDLVLIGSNEVHKSLDTGVPNHERVVLYYETAFFDRYDPDEISFLLSPFQESRVLRLNMKERLQIETLYQSFFAELLEASPGYKLQLRHLATELLLRASRIAFKRNNVLTEEITPTKQKMKEIVQYINSHFHQTLRMNALSKQFYTSPSYLSRIFKEVTGFNMSDYINIVRIKEAQRLLRETDWSVTEISERVGFDNFSHFGKMFKRISLISPRSYRHQCREN